MSQQCWLQYTVFIFVESSEEVNIEINAQRIGYPGVAKLGSATSGNLDLLINN
jgi:predicted Zn-dependent protease